MGLCSHDQPGIRSSIFTYWPLSLWSPITSAQQDRLVTLHAAEQLLEADSTAAARQAFHQVIYGSSKAAIPDSLTGVASTSLVPWRCSRRTT